MNNCESTFIQTNNLELHCQLYNNYISKNSITIKIWHYYEECHKWYIIWMKQRSARLRSTICLQFVWKEIWTSHTSKNRKNYFLSLTYSSRFIFRIKSLLLYGFPLVLVPFSIQCFHFFYQNYKYFLPFSPNKGNQYFFGKQLFLLEYGSQTVHEHFQQSPKNAVLVWIFKFEHTSTCREGMGRGSFWHTQCTGTYKGTTVCFTQWILLFL